MASSFKYTLFAVAYLSFAMLAFCFVVALLTY